MTYESSQEQDTTQAFDALVDTYWESDDPNQARTVSEALVKKATALVGVGLNDEAVVAAEEAIVRLGCSVGTGSELFRRAVAGLGDALIAKAVVLLGEGRHEEGIEVLDGVIGRFQDDVQPSLRRAVAVALSQKVTALADSGRRAETFDTRECMVRHYGDTGVSVPKLGASPR